MAHSKKSPKFIKFNTSLCVEGVCRMLNNPRNCPWLASLDMRSRGTCATIWGCGASKRPKWKRWRSACLRSTLPSCTVWRHRPIGWVWLSSHQCSTRSVPKRSSTENVCADTTCAATNVSERESFHSSRFWGTQQLSLLSHKESSAKRHESATLAMATSSTCVSMRKPICTWQKSSNNGFHILCLFSSKQLEEVETDELVEAEEVATTPLSRGQLKSKGHGKLSIHYAADLETVETIFRIIVSANPLSLYGAVAVICEEYETLHDRTVQPVVGGQSSSSLVLSVIKTEVPLDCDDPVNQDLLSQQYGERIERLSQQDKLSKFCMDAGFLNVVEIGPYFRTKDTAEFFQFRAVACREYTPPREDGASQPKRGIQGNTKLGPYCKSQPVTCTVNMELRSALCLWAETTLTPGSEFLMDQISLWWIWTTMKQKFPKISSKNMR